jgi:DNA-directed RNA polymerase subunit RPC12/RpoP
MIVGWIIFVSAMLILTHEVRCPRCSQRFYVKDVFWQMATRCLHCGQQKYGDVGTAAKSNSQ